MAKRRTRKEKETAQHEFAISWDPENTVKSQKHKRVVSEAVSLSTSKSSNTTASILELGSIKKDIIKSISIASFILVFELVIYFFWK